MIQDYASSKIASTPGTEEAAPLQAEGAGTEAGGYLKEDFQDSAVLAGDEERPWYALNGLDENTKTIVIADEDYYTWMYELGSFPEKYEGYTVEMTEKIQKATAGVIVDYKGITVEEDTALRKECRENAVDYAVVKNTLLRFAFNNTGLSDLDDLLNGTTSLALCDDPVAPARVMANYAKKLDGKFEIKGGFMDGKPVDLATIQSLASIPALPVLQAQVLGTMLAPITGLAVVLKQIAEKNGAPAEEAAPAEESAPAAE